MRKLLLILFILVLISYNVKAASLFKGEDETNIVISYEGISKAIEDFTEICLEFSKYPQLECYNNPPRIIIKSYVDESTLNAMRINDKLLGRFNVINRDNFVDFIENIVNNIIIDENIKEIKIELDSNYNIRGGYMEIGKGKSSYVGFLEIPSQSETQFLSNGRINFRDRVFILHPEGTFKILDMEIKNIGNRDVTIDTKPENLFERVSRTIISFIRRIKIIGEPTVTIRVNNGDKIILRSSRTSFVPLPLSDYSYGFEILMEGSGDLLLTLNEFEDEFICLNGIPVKVNYIKRKITLRNVDWEKISMMNEVDERNCIDIATGDVMSFYKLDDNYYAEKEIKYSEGKLEYNLKFLTEEIPLSNIKGKINVLEDGVKSESGRVIIKRTSGASELEIKKLLA